MKLGNEEVKVKKKKLGWRKQHGSGRRSAVSGQPKAESRTPKANRLPHIVFTLRPKAQQEHVFLPSEFF